MKRLVAIGNAFLLAVIICARVAAADSPRTGFLVIAPDRGFLGNQEVQAVFEEFQRQYTPAALAYVGRAYNRPENEYARYAVQALQQLQEAGASDVVAIPLFLSAESPVVQQVAAAMPAYPGGAAVRWAPPMAESYLIGQILLDRVETVSRNPNDERLIVLASGAMDDTSEAALTRDLDKLVAYVAQRKPFQEARALIYWDQRESGSEAKNEAVDRVIVETAAKKGRTLVVPATMGPKFDTVMSLTNWLARKFSELDLVFVRDELLPHPNIGLWLKKTANRYRAATQAETGVVVMPHGATRPWNDAVEQVIAPVASEYRVEMAYGMGDPFVIQRAVSKLESDGIQRIVLVRMYPLVHHQKEKTDYILGLAPPPEDHGAGHDLPPQVRSAALFASFGGYEEYPEITEVLHDRIVEISKHPAEETVILLAHGERTEQGNSRWLEVMQKNIERLQQDPHCSRLKAILAATVREDWPEQRDKAVAAVRGMVQEASKDGRVLVIADRLYGSGRYREWLDGLEYRMNEKGLAHPALTGWLLNGIRRTTIASANFEESSPLPTQK